MERAASKMTQRHSRPLPGIVWFSINVTKPNVNFKSIVCQEFPGTHFPQCCETKQLNGQNSIMSTFDISVVQNGFEREDEACLEAV